VPGFERRERLSWGPAANKELPDGKCKTQNQPAAIPADIEMIPLTKLMISPKNARKTPATEKEDAELLASIGTTGLKQDLLVHKVGAKYHVHAGGRRLGALQTLAAEGQIKKSHGVPCQAEPTENADDTSVAENLVRSAMCTRPTSLKPLLPSAQRAWIVEAARWPMTLTTA